MQSVLALLKTMRPKQWTKNGFLFAALLFDVKLFRPNYVVQTLAGFILFCLVSGVVYTMNDLVDIEKDREHPTNRSRPLPSGQLPAKFALTAAIVIAAASMIGAFLLSPGFALILGGYLVLQIAYSFYLKNIVLLDVMAIAAGFVLRVAAGALLVNAERFSPWLYLCMTLLALFLGLGKRRGELVLLGENAQNHRESLQYYTLPLMDQLIGVVTSATISGYALYTFSAPNLPTNHTMMLTIPFVIYGIFRYLYLVHAKGTTLAPDEVLITDRAMQIDILLWILAVAAVFYIGK
ncbi:MAG: decaprenyl-phosphate phosphoribosyltransferase [Anaerolineae bacterium]|nr:decaprenyl-phosphate phosphoribosyltransferase [Anaerolineae bacterium]